MSKFKRSRHIHAFLFLLLAVVSIPDLSKAQPKTTLELSVDFSKPLSNFRGYRPDIGYTPLDESYGIYFAVGFGADFKYALGKDRKSKLTSGLSFERFLNHSFSKDPSVPAYNTDVKIFSLFLGYEHAFMPKKTVDPYFGAGFTLNTVNASYFWDPLDVSGKTGFRIGIFANAGFDIKVNKKGGFIFGTKIHYVNLFGKDADPSTIGGNPVSVNDASYIYAGRSYDAINILYLRFYIGYRFTLSQ